MKVIGLVSSPRANGNTQKLVEKALAGAASKGAETKCLNVAKMAVGGCKACNACKKGDGCIQKDDFQTIYQEILEADAVILGSPIYFFDINAQARLVEDRLYCFLGPDMKSKVPPGKKFVIITSQNVPDVNAFAANVKKHETAFSMLGMEHGGTLITAAPTNDDSPDLVKAEEIGRSLV